ncbi:MULTISPECIES: sugar phosphate isomerase/epimerase family protein [unclassified Sporolactobacillus]|uniref:sugar phosphate isomerase/epimerase family protein n=1 Tax=unclassified Sporolactobacillus TaxID=2628533 RepID=UPI0023677B30|nr:sugar phosphate isomerase/epimerase family protein [Sporolactobacillus sp. CQH2019]MDD9150475.1 sugar phosphate isomerase/epimerase [Sporolactobacillus sp. CQH2019]
MKFAVRLNSFKTHLFFNSNEHPLSTLDYIKRMSAVKGLTHIELNYPEHFQGVSAEEIKQSLKKNHLKLSGVALRFKKNYAYGEFTNPDAGIREQAIQETIQAIEKCQALGGEITTIWLANDGFDYPFQLDYNQALAQEVDVLKRITSQFPDRKISLEYKPYQPRTFSLIGDIGTTLLVLDEVGSPNLGVTLDFCHMLMKKENPAYSLAWAARKKRLMGFHLNDGYNDNDDGLMLGTVHLLQTLEFIYYAKLYNYTGVNYFDTFPVRENPVQECEQNIKMYKTLEQFIDTVGLETVKQLIQEGDALKVQKLFLQLIQPN